MGREERKAVGGVGLLVAGSGCTRASAARRLNANDRFQARQSEAEESAVDHEQPISGPRQGAAMQRLLSVIAGPLTAAVGHIAVIPCAEGACAHGPLTGYCRRSKRVGFIRSCERPLSEGANWHSRRLNPPPRAAIRTSFRATARSVQRCVLRGSLRFPSDRPPEAWPSTRRKASSQPCGNPALRRPS
jgi:hypothetical protein